MKKKLKRMLPAALLTMALLLSLTACGSKNETSGKDDFTKKEDSVNKEDIFSDSSSTLTKDDQAETKTDDEDSVLSDGKISGNGWKEGVIKVNGKIFNLSKTTLGQFTECGYTTSDAEMNYILYEDREIKLQDNTHQEMGLTVKNYSSDKPLYQKNALICSYQINYAVENGLEGADVILPGNIKGGMTRDEIVSIMGTPNSSSSDAHINYEYKENDNTVYSLSLYLDEADTLTEVIYRNSCERANITDDFDEIQNSLDTSSESSKTSKTSPSDSLKDAEIKIGSKVYTIPISVTDLSELGYDTDSDDFSRVLNPKETADTSGFYYTDFYDKGGNKLCLDNFYNPSDTPRMPSNCMACKLAFDSESENVSIAKGIKIGSTYKEVCKAFGKKKREEDDDGYSMNYSFSAKRGEVSVKFNFGSSKNKVKQIYMSVMELN